MKSVLISIRPEWCELIASGKKTVEVRKTKPKLETPFKVYIYCTSSNIHECLMQNESGVKLIGSCNYKTAIPCGGHIANGKVIGEFVCDSIKEFYIPYPAYFASVDCDTTRLLTDAMLTKAQAHRYLKTKRGYSWHISDLVIYDRPKELSEFRRYVKDRCTFNEDGVCLGRNQNNVIMCDHLDCCQKEIKRPPQSWCYVEEVQNG